MPKRRETEKYYTNPFLEETAIESLTGYRKIYSRQNKDICLVINPNDGEAKPAGFYFRKEVEKNEFVKLYVKGATALLNLTSAGQKMFQQVYTQIYGKEGKDKTEIMLSYEMMNEEEQKKISRSTFYRGIKELIEARFIAESKATNYYFINPTYIYNGDRLALVTEYITKKQPAEHVRIED